MTLRHIRCDVSALVLLLGPGLQTVAADTRILVKDHICPVIESKTPTNSEFCIANRSPAPADGSLVIVSRNGTDQKVFLIRLDKSLGGNCAPTSSVQREFLCIELKHKTPPKYDKICDFQSFYSWTCEGKQKGKYHNSGRVAVGYEIGGVNKEPSERFYKATRGIDDGDYSAEELLDNALVYRGQPDADSVPLRLSKGAEATSTELLPVRGPAAQSTALNLALKRVETERVQLKDLRALGTEGRFIAENAGTWQFYGAATDCDGQCGVRPLLSQSDFERRLATIGDIVAIERTAELDQKQLQRLRDQLIDRLLMGSTPLPEIDTHLNDMRIVQPVAFLILDWRS